MSIQAHQISLSQRSVPAAPVHNTSGKPWYYRWDPSEVYLVDSSVDHSWKTCVLDGVYFSEPQNSGSTGGRISSVFVIFITSLLVTMFPVVAARVKWLRIPRWAYVTAKNFGTGIIISTAFMHLMEPAYVAIGPSSCVGSTGNWAIYSWCPAIMLAAATFTFLLDSYCDFFAQRWREKRGIIAQGDMHNVDSAIVGHRDSSSTHHSEPKKGTIVRGEAYSVRSSCQSSVVHSLPVTENSANDEQDLYAFYSQIYGFLILEFGIVFHSVMIGLTLGTINNYVTLYIVIIFHQAFEGLGIGARLSMIPFPKSKLWWPYMLCVGYSLATPIATAVGIGIRDTYRNNGYTTLVISGVLDATSAGILLYTGFVELLARDFLFNEERTRNVWEFSAQIFALLCGAGIMALLGKWA